MSDLMKLGQIAMNSELDVGRKAVALREVVLAIQDSFSAIEKVLPQLAEKIFFHRLNF